MGTDAGNIGTLHGPCGIPGNGNHDPAGPDAIAGIAIRDVKRAKAMAWSARSARSLPELRGRLVILDATAGHVMTAAGSIA